MRKGSLLYKDTRKNKENHVKKTVKTGIFLLGKICPVFNLGT